MSWQLLGNKWRDCSKIFQVGIESMLQSPISFSEVVFSIPIRNSEMSSVVPSSATKKTIMIPPWLLSWVCFRCFSLADCSYWSCILLFIGRSSRCQVYQRNISRWLSSPRYGKWPHRILYEVLLKYSWCWWSKSFRVDNIECARYLLNQVRYWLRIFDYVVNLRTEIQSQFLCGSK